MTRLLLTVVALAASAAPAQSAIHVQSSRELAAAVQRTNASGGTIVMYRGRYGPLAIGPRSSNRLTILARDGVTTSSLRLHGTQAVRIEGLEIRPDGGWARSEIAGSTNVVLDRVTVAGGRNFGSNLSVIRSVGVWIVGSEFTRCGEGKTPEAGYCVRAAENHGLTFVGNNFHDCWGCDFVHGRDNAGISFRGNAFLRARPGPCGRILDCHHQDLVDLDDGSDLLIDSNRFGLQEYGAAQIYLTGAMHRVRITNNVFIGSDPAKPGYMSQIGIWVGNRVAANVPRRVAILNNTILSGAERTLRGDDRPTNTAVYLSPLYLGLPRLERPLLANNVLGSVVTPFRLCPFVRASVRNVVVDGETCGPTDVRVRRPGLTPDGQPTAGSTALVDRALPRFATTNDYLGRPRDSKPDIGAYEYGG
jgi:hypothetical protein